MDRYDLRCGLAMLLASAGVILNVAFLQDWESDGRAGWLVVLAAFVGVVIPLATLINCILNKVPGTAVVNAVAVGALAYAAMSGAYSLLLVPQRI